MFLSPSNSTEALMIGTWKKSNKWTLVEFVNSLILKLVESS